MTYSSKTIAFRVFLLRGYQRNALFLRPDEKWFQQGNDFSGMYIFLGLKSQIIEENMFVCSVIC